jgi:hypothetical protein
MVCLYRGSFPYPYLALSLADQKSAIYLRPVRSGWYLEYEDTTELIQVWPNQYTDSFAWWSMILRQQTPVLASSCEAYTDLSSLGA